MPGLIDTHIHFYDVLAVSDPESMQTFEEKELPGRLDSFLQHGITTIKSVGDPTGEILETRAKIAAPISAAESAWRSCPFIRPRDWSGM